MGPRPPSRNSKAKMRSTGGVPIPPATGRSKPGAGKMPMMKKSAHAMPMKRSKAR